MKIEDAISEAADQGREAVRLHQGTVTDISGPLPIVTIAGTPLPMVAIGDHAEGDVVQVLSAGNRWVVLGTVTPGSGPNLVANPVFDYDLTGWGWDVPGTACDEPPPPELPTPLFWYRADDATGAEDDNVTALPSALPGGLGLVSLPVIPGDPGAGGPPKLRIASLGAHQGLGFAEDHPGSWMYGFGDQLFIPVSPGFTVTIHGGCTVFVVARVSSGHGEFLEMVGPSSGGSPGLLSSATFAADLFSANPAPADGQNMWRPFDGIGDNAPYVHEWRYDHPGADVSYRMNGVDQSPAGNYDSPSPNTGRATDAVFNTADGDEYGFSLCGSLNGIWYEIRLYDGVLAGAELAAVRADLASIYGLPA